ncbi:terminase small subunit protein [Bradyrhizobium sp. Pha-3]|uniref:terminase small subunit-like protein n=1 Tax=Bradyrhizobium sp. Pha-3 TaxID=208375 RepID=UPI0035D4D112
MRPPGTAAAGFAFWSQGTAIRSRTEMPKQKAKTGRPTAYTPEIATVILQRLTEGQTLRAVCRDESLPSESTVRTWAMDNREGFGDRYKTAREIGYHAMADEVLELADDGRNDWIEQQGEGDQKIYKLNGEHVQRSRLRFDARRWLLSKALPKIYGDKVALSGDGETPLVVEIVKRTYEDPAAG